MNSQLENLYQQFRRHQREVANEDRGMLTMYPSGRTEMSYGSAPYGEHALSALASARAHVAFLNSRAG